MESVAVLLAQIVAKDQDARAAQDALELLMGAWYNTTMAFVLRVTNGDRELSEEVVQDTFFKLWNSAATLTPDRLRSWVFRVASNLAVDRFRKRDPFREAVPIEPSHRTCNFESDLIDRVQLAEDARRLTLLFLQLPRSYQAPIALYYFRHCSYIEIAHTLHIPLGTVKSRINYGVKRLEKLAQQQGWTSLEIA